MKPDTKTTLKSLALIPVAVTLAGALVALPITVTGNSGSGYGRNPAGFLASLAVGIGMVVVIVPAVMSRLDT